MDSFQSFLEKARVLLEVPQLIDKDYEGNTDELTDPNLYSDSTLNDHYDYIDSINIGNNTVSIYIQNNYDKYLVLGLIPSTEYPKYSQAIFSLNLVELNAIDNNVKSLGSKCLSVSLVYNDNDYRYKTLSTNVYLMLAKMGYVVVSDEIHYKGAKSLWKKLAYLTGMVKVRVFDNDNDTFIIGNDRNEQYNGSNIEDERIWSSDSSNANILLVLSLK